MTSLQYSNISLYFGGIATLTSAFVLVVIASINIRYSMRVQRQTFTTNVMLQLLTNERFSDAYNLILRHAERQETIDPQRLSEDQDNLIASLLSLLEFIAINAETGMMDRRVILRQRKSGLMTTLKVCDGYIRHKRHVWRRPNAYRTFQQLVEASIQESIASSASGKAQR